MLFHLDTLSSRSAKGLFLTKIAGLCMKMTIL
jgi:hypothetical protein